MFISDCLSNNDEEEENGQPTANDQPKVIWLSENPPLASAASLAAEELLTKLEVLASDDPGELIFKFLRRLFMQTLFTSSGFSCSLFSLMT